MASIQGRASGAGKVLGSKSNKPGSCSHVQKCNAAFIWMPTRSNDTHPAPPPLLVQTHCSVNARHPNPQTLPAVLTARHGTRRLVLASWLALPLEVPHKHPQQLRNYHTSFW